MSPKSLSQISKWFILGILMTGLAAQSVKADDPPYKNPNLPIEQRISDLLARMTPEEKARQLYVSGRYQNDRQRGQ